MFYHFLDQLFNITMQLDGNINSFSTYTIDVWYSAWHQYKQKMKEVVKTNG